ncbi:MAG: hypothetical protein ACFFCS_02480 [Candidatus Hodarchaeota archaeon]
MMKEVPARVHVLLARNEPKAVLIIQKRSKLFHVVSWNYLTDDPKEGSWFSGKIYPLRCDLSFDGRHMVYFALGPTEDLFSWSVVCEPPFLKASLLWEHDSTWFGGGVFLEEKSLYMYLDENTPRQNEMQHVPSKNVEKLFKILYRKEDARGDALIQVKMDKDGWREKEFTSSRMVFEKESLQDNSKLVLSCNGSWESSKWHYEHLDTGTGEPVENSPVAEKTRWTDWDSGGCLITAKEGVVTCYDAMNGFEILGSVDCNKFQKN